MFKKLFSRKGSRPDPKGDFVLWQAGREGSGEKKENQSGATRMFNIPVSPGALAGYGRIYVVQGSSGGDGATTVAANLAGLLALSCPERVVLIDLEGYGAVRSRMGLPAGECLVNILDWEDIHGPGEVARGLLNHSSGIMVVPGVIHYDHVEKVDPALVFKMLTLLKGNYDYVVLDCPPAGMNNSTWAAALVADVILTLFRPDRASLDLFQENNSFMYRLGCQDRVCAVLNQAGIPGGIRPGDLEGKSGMNIAGVLPYSVAVAESNNRRQLVAHTRPGDQFTRAMRLLAETIS